MFPRALPWITEIRYNADGPARLMLVSGFGSGPETLRDLAGHVHDTCDATVLVVALAGHGGDVYEFRRSRSWQYFHEAEQRFLGFWAETRRPAHLGGYSTGALVALLIAARHPDKVAGLVLVSPALRLASVGKQILGFTVGSLYFVALPAGLLATLFGYAWNVRRRGWRSTRHLPRVLATVSIVATTAFALRQITVPMDTGGALLRDGEAVLPPHFTRASIVSGSTLVPLQLASLWGLNRLTLPVCIVFGEQDQTVDVRFGSLRLARLRRTQLHVVPDAPHRVVTYEACLTIVSDFIGHRVTPA